MEDLTQHDFQNYYEDTIKALWYWYNNRYIVQLNVIESRKRPRGV